MKRKNHEVAGYGDESKGHEAPIVDVTVPEAATTAPAGARVVRARRFETDWTDVTVVETLVSRPLITEFDWDEAAIAFLRDCVVDFPTLHPSEAAEAATLLEQAVAGATEFTTPPRLRGKNIKPYERHVLGGFGGVLYPSINHSPVARVLRLLYHTIMVRHFAPAVCKHMRKPEWRGKKDVYFRSMWDRAMLRDADAKVTPESWHRDGGESNVAHAVRLGGWIALQTAGGQPQQLVCVPGSSLWRVIDCGFGKVSKDTLRPLEARKKVHRVKIGRCVVFDETIVHCVQRSPKARKAKGAPPPAPQVRIFIASELSCEPPPSEELETIHKQLLEGAVLPLKSGQRPRGYPAMYWCYPRLREYLHLAAERLQPVMREKRHLASKGVDLTTPFQMEPPSLVAQGVAPPPYTDAEIDAFVKPVKLPLGQEQGTSVETKVQSTD